MLPDRELFLPVSLVRLRFGADLVVLTSRLVGGAGDIKLTKDGNTLLKEMVGVSCALGWAGPRFVCLVTMSFVLVLQFGGGAPFWFRRAL